VSTDNSKAAVILARCAILGPATAVFRIITSGIVAFGFRMAGKPPDERHPYGHGKFEPLSAAIVSLILFAAAITIAVESVKKWVLIIL
jgi:divalent metal cation (Fe/Co/Zn/Cd) transporter